MATAVAPKLMTADEFFRISDPKFLQLTNGRIDEMAPAGFEHSSLAAELLAHVHLFLRETDLGVVVGEAGGFLLRHDPDTVRAADIAFVLKARAERGWTAKFFDGPPDLAVEIVSPHDTWNEITEKAALWMSCGCQSVWIVDPRQKAIFSYRPQDGALVPFGAVVTDPVLPGFSLDVAAFFKR